MKSMLTRVLVAILFVGLIYNSQAAFANTNLYRKTLPSWGNSFQTGVTKRSYKRMKIGMTFKAVNKIIGFTGTIMTQNYGGGKEFISVKWEGKNYAIITAVFRDRILTDKYEANLR